MPHDRDSVDVIEDQLRAVAPELGEGRIREIAIELRQHIGGRKLYARKGSSEARHDVPCVKTEANTKATEARRPIAKALDLTDERINQLAKLGMPLDNIEAAIAWRTQHVPRGRKPPIFFADDTTTASDAQT